MLQKRERDLAVQVGEQANWAGPEALELGAQLVTKRLPRLDQVLAPAAQRLQRLGLIAVRLQHPEAVVVGARQLAQHERVEPVGLAARWPESRAGRRHLVGVQRQHLEPGVEQPLDQHPVRALDRDQLNLEAHKLATQRLQPRLIMGERRGQQLPARRVLHDHLVALRRPVHSSVTSHQYLLLIGQDFTAPRPRGTLAGAH